MTQERSESYRVGVIGGGVIALCSAFYLQRQGHEVTIFEKDALGSGASRGNGGQIVTADPLPAPGMVREGLRHWLSPSSAFYIHPRSLFGLSSFLTQFALNANSRTYQAAFNKLDRLNRLRTHLFDELAEEGIGDHFVATGNLRAFSVRETALRDWQAARKLAVLGLTQEPGDFLDAQDLHAIEPTLGTAARWGFLRPDVRFGDPSRFIDQLSHYLSAHGVKHLRADGREGSRRKAGVGRGSARRRRRQLRSRADRRGARLRRVAERHGRSCQPCARQGLQLHGESVDDAPLHRAAGRGTRWRHPIGRCTPAHCGNDGAWSDIRRIDRRPYRPHR